MPLTPEVSAAAVLRALELFPDHRSAPDLTGIDVADYLAPEFAAQAVADAQ